MNGKKGLPGCAESEASIQQAIRIRLSQERGLVLWRNSQGVTVDVSGMHKAGLGKGSSDLVGILAPGRFIALEVKTPAGRVSKEQEIFIQLVRSQGGFAAVVRSVEEALSAIERARRGESE